MGVAENVAAVRDFIERAWNGGDESVFEEHLSADFDFPGGLTRLQTNDLHVPSRFRELPHGGARHVRRRRQGCHCANDARNA